MKFITVAALFSSASAENYNYENQGKDWGSIIGYEDCSLKGGSPIQLKSNVDDYPKIDSDADDLALIYTNQRSAKVEWSD